MKQKLILLSVIALTLGCSTALAGEEEPYEIRPAPKNLAHFVELEGTWNGTGKNKKGEVETIQLQYRTVAGGSVVEERIFVGTPKEMLTTYHGADNGTDILMKHYCMLGNQPQLKMSATDGKTFTFEFAGGTGFDRAKDGHMGAMKMTKISADKMQQAWTYYEDGKPQFTNVFTFTRAQ